MRKVIKITTVIIIFLISLSCREKQVSTKKNKEILIYCGITMVKPVKEIAGIFEKENNCKVKIFQGGSEELYKILRESQVGDLYLPGSSWFRDNYLSEGYLKDYVYVGYNQAALIVRKGNPKNITAELKNLMDERYSVVIGNPEIGSIGKEGRKILKKAGIFDEVIANSVALAVDSRTMNIFVIDKTADIALNWAASAKLKSTKPHLDILYLPDSIASRKKLLLNLLSFSKHPKLAQAFMNLAVSDRGRRIFCEYGFLDRETLNNKSSAGQAQK